MNTTAITFWWSGLRGWQQWTLAYVGLLLFQGAWAFVGFDLWYEGELLYNGWRMLLGEGLAWPPISTALTALSMSLFGESVFGARVIWWLLGPVVVLLWYAVAAQWIRADVAKWGAIPVALAPGAIWVRGEIIVLFACLLVLSVSLFRKIANSGRRGRWYPRLVWSSVFLAGASAVGLVVVAESFTNESLIYQRYLSVFALILWLLLFIAWQPDILLKFFNARPTSFRLEAIAVSVLMLYSGVGAGTRFQTYEYLEHPRIGVGVSPNKAEMLRRILDYETALPTSTSVICFPPAPFAHFLLKQKEVWRLGNSASWEKFEPAVAFIFTYHLDPWAVSNNVSVDEKKFRFEQVREKFTLFESFVGVDVYIRPILIPSYRLTSEAAMLDIVGLEGRMDVREIGSGRTAEDLALFLSIPGKATYRKKLEDARRFSSEIGFGHAPGLEESVITRLRVTLRTPQHGQMLLIDEEVSIIPGEKIPRRRVVYEFEAPISSDAFVIVEAMHRGGPSTELVSASLRNPTFWTKND